MEQGLGSVLDIINIGTVPLALIAAMELNVLEILANAGPGANLSASEIVSKVPAKNPNAVATLDRILRFLACNSILSSTIGAEGKRHYGLTPKCKYFLRDKDGISCAPMILSSLDKAVMEGWYCLKDPVLEGCVPFNKVHGMTAFEYCGKDERMGKLFNDSMFSLSTNLMRDVIENYRGFEGLKEVVDVGGGIGASLKMIIAKYPQIRGINFDLPQVVANAPPIAGVRHVGGDMFENVPSGDAILMKWILHDWDEERCVKILKNCWKALPDSGKVILVEFVLPLEITDDPMCSRIVNSDVMMLVVSEGGKERTIQEYETLAKESGFAATKAFPCTYGISAIELYKDA